MQNNQIAKRAGKTFELQENEADCGVATLSSIIKFFKGYIPKESLRALSGTTESGTSMLGIIQASEAIGLKSEAYEASINDLITLDSPAILHVVKDSVIEHFIIVYYSTSDKCLIGDPEIGLYNISLNELDEIWKSKALLLFTTTKEFKLHNKDLRTKYKWFYDIVKKDSNLIITTFSVGLIIAFLNFATAIFTEKLVDNLLPSKDIQKILTAVFAWFVLVSFRVFFVYIKEILSIRYSFTFNVNLVSGFINRLIRLEKPFFDRRRKGDLIARLYDTNRIQASFGILITQDLIDLLTLFSSILFVSFYSPQIAIFLLILSPLYFLLGSKYYKLIYSNNMAAMSSYAQNENHFIDTFSGMATIKRSNLEDALSNKLLKSYKNYQKTIADIGKTEYLFKLTNDSFGALSILFIFLYCISEVLNENILLGDMLAIFGISTIAMSTTNKLSFASTHLQEANVAMERTFEVVSQPIEKKNGIEILNIERIIFHNISFHYPGQIELINNFNLSVAKGSWVILEGQNGSGKSTLFELLQRFYNPIDGVITCNGIDIKEIDLISYRSKIGVVPQSIKIFNESLKYNICLDEDISFEVVEEFCQAIGLSQYFNSFKDGLQTIAGEDGVNISGGQKQMVGFARAMFQNPQVLLLDEFTSALDRDSRSLILSILKDKKDLACLIITHDPEIIKMGDIVNNMESSQ